MAHARSKRTGVAAEIVALAFGELTLGLALSVDEFFIGAMRERNLDILVCSNVRRLCNLLVGAFRDWAVSDERSRSHAQNSSDKRKLRDEAHVEWSSSFTEAVKPTE